MRNAVWVLIIVASVVRLINLVHTILQEISKAALQ
jgi:hypothetical protein